MARLPNKITAGMGALMGGGGIPRQFKPSGKSANLSGFAHAAMGRRAAPVSPGLTRAPR